MLENYAVLNYCGLSKILKKHDKCTGFATREKFMINMVVKQVRILLLFLILRIPLLDASLNLPDTVSCSRLFTIRI
jgi:SPX domain protein involved in polyphosphate accumulation